MKIVYQFKTNGELVGEYKSIADAARSVGVTKETISMVCNGKRNTSAGFLWSFNNKVDVRQNNKEKEWRDIKGFEGQYQMSEDREIRKLPFSVTKTDNDGNTYTSKFCGGVIEQRVDSQGYLSATLNHNNYRIHWLYYNTFIGDSTGMIIDHIDRNRLNNNPSNLRLVTPKENVHNRTLPYRPDIQDMSKYQQYKNKSNSHPFQLRFTDNGKRISIGYFKTYEEAENKYRELYNERQKRIDASI